MKALTKAEADYITSRINSVAMCLSGKVNEEIDKRIGEEPEKVTDFHITCAAINEGKAKVTQAYIDSESSYIYRKELANGVYFEVDKSFYKKYKEIHTKVFTEYKEKEAIADIERDERIQVIHLTAQHMKDQVLLGIVDRSELPAMLEAFSKEVF